MLAEKVIVTVPNRNHVRILPGYDDRRGEALVERIVEDGAELQVELKLSDGRSAWSRLTPDQTEELELQEGEIRPVSRSRTS